MRSSRPSRSPSFTAQTHLAYVSLSAVLAVWLVAWCLFWPRLLPADDPGTAELPRPFGDRWRTALRRSVVVVVVLWIGPLLDAVFGLQNPWHIARSFGGGTARIGLVQAVGLAGYDGLSPGDRAWLSDLQLRRLGDPDAITPEEDRRNDALAPHDLRVGVFESPSPCAREADHEITRTADGSILAVTGGAVGHRLLRRRRASAADPT